MACFASLLRDHQRHKFVRIGAVMNTADIHHHHVGVGGGVTFGGGSAVGKDERGNAEAGGDKDPGSELPGLKTPIGTDLTPNFHPAATRDRRCAIGVFEPEKQDVAEV